MKSNQMRIEIASKIEESQGYTFSFNDTIIFNLFFLLLLEGKEEKIQ